MPGPDGPRQQVERLGELLLELLNRDDRRLTSQANGSAIPIGAANESRKRMPHETGGN